MPKWTTLTGLTAEAACRDGWLDTVHPNDADCGRIVWETAVAHGAADDLKLSLRYADVQYPARAARQASKMRAIPSIWWGQRSPSRVRYDRLPVSVATACCR